MAALVSYVAKVGFGMQPGIAATEGVWLRSTITALESYSSNLLGAKYAVDHFMAVSDFVRDKMIEHGMPKTKITTVHNFVRDDVFSDNDNEGRYLLYVGRVEKIKGVGTLIRAMALVTEVDLYVVGTGEAKRNWNKKSARIGLTNVKFLGFKSGQELRDLIGGRFASLPHQSGLRHLVWSCWKVLRRAGQ